MVASRLVAQILRVTETVSMTMKQRYRIIVELQIKSCSFFELVKNA